MQSRESRCEEEIMGAATGTGGANFQSTRWSQFNPEAWVKRFASEVDWLAIHFIQEVSQSRSVRNEKLDPVRWGIDEGVRIEVMINGHLGYAGTSSMDPQAIENALHRAVALTHLASAAKAFDFPRSVRPPSLGSYQSPVRQNLDSTSLAELNDFLMRCTRSMAVSPLIVQRMGEVSFTRRTQRSASSNGSHIEQDFLFFTSNFIATAQEGSETQKRSTNGPVARCFQGGLEQLAQDQLLADCKRIGEQALELLRAENCPSGRMDTILAPDQLYLQIHESIGHPLELDRILGDERNYAGWSFVKLSDFGHLQYGSPLLNVVFDPTVKGEFASYSFDESGLPSRKEYLIKDGVLLRALGSLESQIRAKTPGVANFRSASWNRAPIDRMANINIEPGQTSLKDMIASVDRGILMEANQSWSIDDYRDKFQFGCEYARLIENGKLTQVVKNPNYRGRTLEFWSKLKAVGSAQDWEVYGSPYCGKGEPNQVIRVGHASPHCLFGDLEVFGG